MGNKFVETENTLCSGYQWLTSPCVILSYLSWRMKILGKSMIKRYLFIPNQGPFGHITYIFIKQYMHMVLWLSYITIWHIYQSVVALW